ncbi:hypothetical protein LWC33_34390 [Pseudonocardia sp. RS11V-5]|uniref:hypothetical protein n=1 Tax=Pseudonocardia terrae TaxID=2905831 RepID=UPI001E3F37D7|nr:hypothetical protein [Pseudonocardia terrae]MCE3556515.1 hypothetical protein [Pseudonocardia terrae]
MGTVRFHSGKGIRVEDVAEARLRAEQVDVASCEIYGTDPKPDLMPDKQVHRWINEGGALLPHD